MRHRRRVATRLFILPSLSLLTLPLCPTRLAGTSCHICIGGKQMFGRLSSRIVTAGIRRRVEACFVAVRQLRSLRRRGW